MQEIGIMQQTIISALIRQGRLFEKQKSNTWKRRTIPLLPLSGRHPGKTEVATDLKQPQVTKLFESLIIGFASALSRRAQVSNRGHVQKAVAETHRQS